MERDIGFITCDTRAESPWRSQLDEQLQRLFQAGRTNIVVMLDTLPVPDARTIELLVEFREDVLNAGGQCTFVALHNSTIAALQRLAPVAALRIIERVVDLPHPDAA